MKRLTTKNLRAIAEITVSSQIVMFPDFKFAESKVEKCPVCGRLYDKDHVVPNENYKI